jgi:hypothetical protein
LGTPGAALSNVITIVRDIPIKRITDFPNAGPFNIQALNAELDKLTAVQQNLETDLDNRVLRLGDSDTPNTLSVIPNKAARQNKLLGFDVQGQPTAYDAASLATLVAYATAYADTFTGDGIDTTFTLSGDPAVIANLDVSINGVTQVPLVDYTLSGTTLTTTTAVPNGAVMLVKYKEGLPNYSGDAQDIRYTAGFSGAAQQNVKTKLEQYVSVKDFGAVGDGVTDDTIAIQAAIDSGANRVAFPSGTYLIGTEIVCQDSVFLDFYAATLKTNSNITMLRFGAGPTQALTYSHGGISGTLTIEGSGAANTSNDGLVVRNYSYGNFNASVLITNCGGRAFALEAYGRGVQYNWFGGGWEFKDNYGTVFDINAGVTAGGYVNDNAFNSIRTHEQLTAGLTHARMRGLQVDSNRFYNVAFETQDATDTLLSIEDATANGFYGLRLDGVTGTINLDIAAGVTGNMFYGYTTDGSVVDASDKNIFFGDQGGGNYPYMRFGSALNDGTQQAWEFAMAQPGTVEELRLGALKTGGIVRMPSSTVFNIGDREGSDTSPVQFDPANKRLLLSTLSSTAIGSGPQFRWDGRFSSSGNFGVHTMFQDAYGITVSPAGGYGFHSNTYISVADGITAPSAQSGRARIYVDSADGDLKIVFGDGTVKTIVTDS